MSISTIVGARTQRKLLITVAEWSGASKDIYTLQTEQPADWATGYASYYTKSGSVYSAVTGAEAPTWTAGTYYTKTTTTQYREILGVRTEDSSIEFNPDTETSTDIRGNTYTDVNKTEPQQDFDPFYVLGGSDLAEYLSDAALENDIAKYNGAFNIYIIEAYKDSGVSPAHAYKCIQHTQCSIIPTSIGGDAYISMPIEVHLSNKITVGTVDKLTNDFIFS